MRLSELHAAIHTAGDVLAYTRLAAPDQGRLGCGFGRSGTSRS